MSELQVVAAAIRFDLSRLPNLVHAQATDLVLSVPAPGRHHNVIYLGNRLGFELDDCEYEFGFTLSDGTFATRERAHQVATAANQIIRRCGGDERELYSENVW